MYEDTLLFFWLPLVVQTFYKSNVVGYFHHQEQASITRSVGSKGAQFYDRLAVAAMGVEKASTYSLDRAERKRVHNKFTDIFLVHTLEMLKESGDWRMFPRVLKFYRKESRRLLGIKARPPLRITRLGSTVLLAWAVSHLLPVAAGLFRKPPHEVLGAADCELTMHDGGATLWLRRRASNDEGVEGAVQSVSGHSRSSYSHRQSTRFVRHLAREVTSLASFCTARGRWDVRSSTSIASTSSTGASALGPRRFSDLLQFLATIRTIAGTAASDLKRTFRICKRLRVTSHCDKFATAYAHIQIVRRGYLLAQAISFARAEQTGEWISRGPASGLTAVYDRPLIRRCLIEMASGKRELGVVLSRIRRPASRRGIRIARSGSAAVRPQGGLVRRSRSASRRTHPRAPDVASARRGKRCVARALHRGNSPRRRGVEQPRRAAAQSGRDQRRR